MLFILLIRQKTVFNINRKIKFQQKNADVEEVSQENSGHVTPHPSDVLDMPVDPNEPTYCLCHQVSYGEMIGCDNPEVIFIKNKFKRIEIILFLYFSVQLNGFILLVLV